MNRLYFIAILLLSFVFTSQHSYSQSTGYEINVKVDGIADSLVYLANYFGDKQYLKDSIHADANGSFTFKGEEALPGGIYLIVLPGKKYFEIIVDQQQHFSVSTKNDDYVKHMKISGSSDNQRFYDYLNFMASKTKEIEPLRAQHNTLKETDEAEAAKVMNQMKQIDSAVVAYRKNLEVNHPEFLLSKVIKTTEEIKMPEAPMNPDGTKDSLFLFNYYKQHYWDNVDLKDDRLLFTPVFFPKLETYFKNMVLQTADSVIKDADFLIGQLKPKSEMFKFVVWWITNKYETSNIMGMDAVFVHMAENYYTKEKAFWIDDTQLFKIQDRASVLKPLLVGTKVKNLVLKNPAGEPQSLYNVKAKYTILYFWDPDCGHCKKVTPKLKEYYDEVKGKGIEVFAVNSEVEEDKWKAFIKEHNLNWINVADMEIKNNFRHDFDISSTPQTFLLDENKVIIAKKIELETLKEIIQKKLEEK